MSKVYGFSVKTDQIILRELEERIYRGWKPNLSDWKKLDKILKNLQNRVKKYLGPYSLQWIPPQDIEPNTYEKILNDLYELPLDERRKIVSKISSNEKYHDLLERLDPLTLSPLGERSKLRPSLRNKALLGYALSNYLNYLITMDQSYLDYSEYILSKIREDELEPSLRPLYRSLLNSDTRDILKYLHRFYPLEVLEHISLTVWNSIRTRGFDRELIWRAIKIGYEVLKYSLRGIDDLGRYRFSYSSGRVSIRKTIYNYTRLNYVIVRREREKTMRVVAIVDVSGSMLKYSTWAILSLSSIISIVKTVILFSDKASITKPPRSFSKHLVISYLEKLFSEGFTGYTNISSALRLLNNVAGLNDTAILFSDLEQTIKDVEPWREVERFLRSGSRRLLVFVPPRYRVDVGKKFQEVGAELVVVKQPVEIPKLLKKKLNLKIRVNIFPSKR